MTATEVVVVLALALALAAGAALGRRCGARRTIGRAVPLGLAWSCGALAGWVALRAGWLWPFGLLTPALAGSAVACVVARTTAPPRSAPRSSLATVDVPRVDRTVGAVLGALGAMLAVAGIWFALSVAALTHVSRRSVERSTESGTVLRAGERGAGESALRAVLATAHAGVVRHLPVVGPWSDEMAALLEILAATDGERRRLAMEEDLQRFADLPSLRAALEDETVFADIDALREGDPFALYRLQRNPRVLALLRSPDLGPALERLRPTTLAARLAR